MNNFRIDNFSFKDDLRPRRPMEIFLAEARPRERIRKKYLQYLIFQASLGVAKNINHKFKQLGLIPKLEQFVLHDLTQGQNKNVSTAQTSTCAPVRNYLVIRDDK